MAIQKVGAERGPGEEEGGGGVDRTGDTREVARVEDERRRREMKLGSLGTRRETRIRGTCNRCRATKSRQHLAESLTNARGGGGGGTGGGRGGEG